MENRKKEHWTIALAKLRHQHNLSQKQMAKIIGVSEKTIYRWESNHNSKLNLHTCEIICRKFNLSFKDFLEGRLKTVDVNMNHKINYVCTSIAMFVIFLTTFIIRIYSKDTITYEAITIMFPNRDITKLYDYLFVVTLLGLLVAKFVNMKWPYRPSGINVLGQEKRDK